MSGSPFHWSCCCCPPISILCLMSSTWSSFCGTTCMLSFNACPKISATWRSSWPTINVKSGWFTNCFALPPTSPYGDGQIPCEGRSPPASSRVAAGPRSDCSLVGGGCANFRDSIHLGCISNADSLCRPRKLLKGQRLEMDSLESQWAQSTASLRHNTYGRAEESDGRRWGGVLSTLTHGQLRWWLASANLRGDSQSTPSWSRNASARQLVAPVLFLVFEA